MKKITLLLLFMCFLTISFSQSSKVQLQLRLPIQLDMQKAEIVLPLRIDEQKASTINFGLDVLIKYKIKKYSFYTGIGYFRNRFNIKRGYDHQALNIGTDSLPVGTDTKNYDYSLIRIPLGFTYEVLRNKNINVNVGAEFFNNFSFRRKYNGRLPFDGANTVYNGFNYFGNSLNFFLSLSKKNIEFEPYLRLYNSYKKDRFLKELETEKTTRYFDAIGISFRYSFTL